MELTPSGEGGGNLDMANRTSESSQSNEVIQLEGGGERRVEQSSSVQSEQRVQQSVSSKSVQSSSIVKQESFSSSVKSSSSSQQVPYSNGNSISGMSDSGSQRELRAAASAADGAPNGTASPTLNLSHHSATGS